MLFKELSFDGQAYEAPALKVFQVSASSPLMISGGSPEALGEENPYAGIEDPFNY